MWESKGEIMAKGDVYRIEQVIMNYINNALNHVDENKAIRIKAEEKNEKIRVSVYNSGSPIPETIIEDIWSSFYKADKARSREYGGTGLGLSVVRAVQEAHKNSYGVLNTNKGVEFWFDIDKAGF